jgi:hypothetical protein
VIRAKLVYQVFRVIKVSEEIAANQVKKAFRASQVFLEFRVFREKKVKKEKLDHRVIRVIKDSAETKEIKAKLDHSVIKEREVIKVKKE